MIKDIFSDDMSEWEASVGVMVYEQSRHVPSEVRGFSADDISIMCSSNVIYEQLPDNLFYVVLTDKIFVFHIENEIKNIILVGVFLDMSQKSFLQEIAREYQRDMIDGMIARRKILAARCDA